MPKERRLKGLASLPVPVRYFFIIAVWRSFAFFGLAFTQWLNISERTSAASMHLFHMRLIVFLVDAVMLYFLSKRKRFAWIYQIAMAALLLLIDIYDFGSPTPHPYNILEVLLEVAPVALICGFMPVTLRWFWRQPKPDAEAMMIQNMVAANGTTTPYDLQRLAPDAEPKKAAKPVWSVWKSIGLFFMIAISMLAIYLPIHDVQIGHASSGRFVADIHKDPKHFWFYAFSDFCRFSPAYVLTITMWRKWRASKQA